MKLKFVSTIAILFFFFHYGSTQTSILYKESFTEYTTEEDRFSIYLDTAEAYVYQDIDKTKEALLACQSILDNGAEIEISEKFDFITTSIYHHYVKLEPLEAYNIILDNEEFIKQDSVTDHQSNRFEYLKSFTLMSLGDIEAAQKGYYLGVEEGKMARDTKTVIDNLYSLGQLFDDEEDYEQSINYYNEVLSYIDIYDMPEVTVALTYLELAMSLTESENYTDAKTSLLNSINYVEKFDLDYIWPSILMEKGQIHFLLNEVDSLENVLEQMRELNKGEQDANYLLNLYSLQSKMHRATGDHTSAIKVYKKILEKVDKTNLDVQIDAHSNISALYEKIGDYESAFQHLLLSKDLEDKKANDEKRQKTAYLKIRYNSEQKEKDNALLKATLFEQRANQNLLFGGLIFAAMTLLGLFAAFKQKAKYSRRLEETVSSRTKRLKKSNSLLNESNAELEEMNRILSHDLKEPIRSVVSFSELIQRDETLSPKSKKYIEYVKKSGKQLDKLIQDVNLLRDTDNLISRVISYNANELLQQVIQDLQESSNKNISLICPPIPTIKGAKDVMRNIFFGIIQNSVNFNQNEAVKIEVSYAEENRMHTFHIKDNGIGIEKEYHDQIFDLFKRLNNQADFSGTGLGLSIVKRFVDSLGGKISVYDSEIDVGTTIEIKHPKVD